MRGHFSLFPLIRLQKMSALGHFLNPPSPEGEGSICPINGSSNIPPRERTGRNEMRNDSHPTTSPEIVSGHCPPDKRELSCMGVVLRAPNFHVGADAHIRPTIYFFRKGRVSHPANKLPFFGELSLPLWGRWHAARRDGRC